MVRPDSILRPKAAASLKWPGVGDVSSSGDGRCSDPVLVLPTLCSRESGVGNGVRLFSVSLKRWADVERVDLRAAFLDRVSCETRVCEELSVQPRLRS